MTNYSKNINWIEMWETDVTSILECMIRNMNADLNCGYDPKGNSIKKQVADIANYQMYIDNFRNQFVELGEEKFNRKCFIELKRKGAIE